MDGWMDGWMDGDGWVDGWKNENSVETTVTVERGMNLATEAIINFRKGLGIEPVALCSIVFGSCLAPLESVGLVVWGSEVRPTLDPQGFSSECSWA